MLNYTRGHSNNNNKAQKHMEKLAASTRPSRDVTHRPSSLAHSLAASHNAAGAGDGVDTSQSFAHHLATMQSGLCFTAIVSLTSSPLPPSCWLSRQEGRLSLSLLLSVCSCGLRPPLTSSQQASLHPMDPTLLVVHDLPACLPTIPSSASSFLYSSLSAALR